MIIGYSCLAQVIGHTQDTRMWRLSVGRDHDQHELCLPAVPESVWLLMSLFPLLANDHLAHNLVDFLAVLSPGVLLCILIL